ncbi:MAG TPA: UDP-N-acetylglucosamine 2-epimerase (non-hydrolyzing) [Ignavibacteria bacterium]|nr:UDP-N-acetylglucosamine 2-epimerase (non-hydrolyzing) [Ignavibacteria bacterium]
MKENNLNPESFKNKKIVLIVFGTRPEIIKLFVLYRILQKSDEFFPVLVNTSQQQISGDILKHLGITPEVVLNEIKNRSTDLNQFISHTLNELNLAFTDKSVIKKNEVAGVIVQGDTTSAYCGAIWGFYNQIPVFHVEAGLRTFDHLNPFPEEFVRESIGRAATMNFCPTNISYDNLIREGIKSNKCYVVGNTVNDAIITLMNEGLIKDSAYEGNFILSTLHRRENWGNVSDYAKILNKVVHDNEKEKYVLHLIHPNPLVKNNFNSVFGGKYPENLIVREPIHDYFEMLGLVRKSHTILTDSGGLQEESLFFNVPCGVLRKVTERPEVLGKNAKLLPFEDNKVTAFLDESEDYRNKNFGKFNYTYGYGNTSELIYEAMKNFYS